MTEAHFARQKWYCTVASGRILTVLNLSPLEITSPQLVT